MSRWKLGQSVTLCICWSAAILTFCPPPASAEGTSKKPIRVALYADKGATINALPEVMDCLPESKGFTVTKVLAKEIRSGALDQYDVLICPGGSGSGEGKALGDEGRERVRTFVKGGGGYIGICAGAIWRRSSIPGRWVCSTPTCSTAPTGTAAWATSTSNFQRPARKHSHQSASRAPFITRTARSSDLATRKAWPITNFSRPTTPR